VVDGIFGFTKENEVSGPSMPLIHCDSQDYIYLTFMAWEIGSKVGDYLLFIDNINGDWSDPQLAAQGGFITDSRSMIDNDDKLHFVFVDRTKGINSAVFYTNHRNYEFFKPVKVSAEKHTFINSPDIADDSLGKAHVKLLLSPTL